MRPFIFVSTTIRLLFLHKSKYRKIPKINPGAYIFRRLFLRGLFLEGLIFGGAYLRRKICVSKSIGLALQLEVNLPFLLCFTSYLGAIFQVQAPKGLIFGGAYTWRGLFSEFYGIQPKEIDLIVTLPSPDRVQPRSAPCYTGTQRTKRGGKMVSVFHV